MWVPPPTSPNPSVHALRRILAHNIRTSARERDLWPLERLAIHCRVAKSQLYIMLRARVNASIDHLVPISAGLGVPTHALVAIDRRPTVLR